MASIFTAAELDLLARPHIARAWFGEFDLPTGLARLHNGVGTVSVGGYDWRGVSDPLTGQLVSVGQIEEPEFGQATAVTLTIAGASREFIRSVHATARQIEGRAAEIYWAAFDQETQQIAIGLKRLFPRGRMTSPSLDWAGINRRVMTLTVENVWSTVNFAPGGKWNGAGQRKRFLGDAGLDFVGVKVQENWQ